MYLHAERFLFPDATIEEFLSIMREIGANITTKLHILEVHVVPFIKQWGYGLSIFSEQGGEKLHSQFKKIEAQYSAVPKGVNKLKSMLQNHLCILEE